MFKSAERRLSALLPRQAGALFSGSRYGIEKESLRVLQNGYISQRPHPVGLGSALTHPQITTDFSEALIEMITPPCESLSEGVAVLCDLHQYVYQKLDDELLWATSMPCMVAGDKSVPIARYGDSNVGRMKHIYRLGLGYRYGRVMQTIAGIHFNYSFSEQFWQALQAVDGHRGPLAEFVSAGYFRLIRNFQRYGWMVPYLFGSSPAICRSFLAGRSSGFDEFDDGTYFQRYATSLRMSDVGYKNKNQAGLGISYDSLDRYVHSLSTATNTPVAEYEGIGVVRDGEYRQLNSNVLQIENEFYSFIRPKQIALSGEKPTLALQRRGVQYIEIRALDVSVFDPTGANLPQLRFLEAFIALCLLTDSPLVSGDELEAIEYNQKLVACCGRDPALRLRWNGTDIALRDWATEICTAMEGICTYLDGGSAEQPYTSSLAEQIEAARDPDRIPSARILAENAYATGVILRVRVAKIGRAQRKFQPDGTRLRDQHPVDATR